MKSMRFQFLVAVIFINFLYSQNHISFESGGMSNQDVMTEWASSGSNACISHRYPDYIFNAVEDLGMDNNMGGNNSYILNNFLRNGIDSLLDPFFNNKLVMIYFPPGQYWFSSTIDVTFRGKIIFKGSGINTQFIFDTNYENFKVKNDNGVPINIVGFEDFYISHKNGDTDDRGFTFSFENVSDCWISGVKSYYTYKAHVFIISSSHITVTGCYLHNGHDFGSGGHGYGVNLSGGATHCLIENNILHTLRHGVLLQQDADFNVIGYNSFINGGQRAAGNYKADVEFHGKLDRAIGPSYNLVEGNDFYKSAFSFFNNHDDNGPYNVFLRNAAEIHDGNAYYPTNHHAGPDHYKQNYILSDPSDDWGRGHINLVDSEPWDDLVSSHSGKIEDHSDHLNWVYSYYKSSIPDFLTVGVNWPYYRNGMHNGANLREINQIYQEDELWDKYECEPFFARNKLFLLPQVILNSTTPYHYRGGEKIANQDFLLISGSTVFFVAGEEIQLNPGFGVDTGSFFCAKIGDCTAPFNRTSNFSLTGSDLINQQLIPEPIPVIVEDQKILVYPNPAKDQFIVEITGNVNNDLCKVTLYSVMAERVLEKTFVNNNNLISIDVSALDKGIYFAKVEIKGMKESMHRILIEK